VRERKKTLEGGAVLGLESKGGGGVVAVVPLRRDSKAGGVEGVVSQAGAENEEKLRDGLNAAWLGGEKLSSGAAGGGASGTTSIQVRPIRFPRPPHSPLVHLFKLTTTIYPYSPYIAELSSP